MNFNNFIRSKSSPQKQEPSGAKSQGQMPNQSQIEDMVNHYKNLPQDQLIQELIKQTNAQKKSGKWNSQSMEQLYGTIKPMLNAEQQKNLEYIKKLLE